MKLKLLIIGLIVAGLSVSAAVAAPPPGKGKPAPSAQPTSPSAPAREGQAPKTGDNQAEGDRR
jgi:hypothetical protein